VKGDDIAATLLLHLSHCYTICESNGTLGHIVRQCWWSVFFQTTKNVLSCSEFFAHCICKNICAYVCTYVCAEVRASENISWLRKAKRGHHLSTAVTAKTSVTDPLLVFPSLWALKKQ